ncbi:hypothetical protein ACIKP7_01420 [Pseudomonas caricapapayae]|uniref:Uncharacterized protein n=1 Tax=Pseudomonas caricapapayae TaxID=46678 RepID=A0ACC7LV70_9PSED
MDTNKMREQFEAWVLREWPEQSLARFTTGEYQGFTVEHCWQSWQASREAVMVELPPKISAHNTSESGWVRPEAEHYDEAIDDCREAIEHLGLKVTP